MNFNASPKITNIVATFQLFSDHKKEFLNLREISLKARNVEYNPKRISALIVRIKNPKTTALLFHTGKCVVTGAKTFQESHLAARKFARMFQKFNANVSLFNFKIQNLVATTSFLDIGSTLSLEIFQILFYTNSRYEPEIFPGLTLEIPFNGKIKPIVINIFKSGKAVITGCFNCEQIDFAFNNLLNMIKSNQTKLIKFNK